MDMDWLKIACGNHSERRNHKKMPTSFDLQHQTVTQNSDWSGQQLG